MAINSVVVVLCLVAAQLADATTPVITNGNTQTANVDEGVSAGTTVLSLTSSVTALFTLSGTDASFVTAAPTTGGTPSLTGTITINSSPDFQTKSSYTFTVTATNGVDTTAVAVTLSVVNKSPTFSSAGYSACLCDGDGAGTAVVTVTGTPVNTGVTVAYSINTGNTDSVFSVGPSSGAITIATSKSVSASTLAGYMLVVYGKDTGSPVQTGTTSVYITVASCSGTSTITGTVAAIMALGFSVIQKLLQI